MYVEKYFPMLSKDIADCEDALAATLPDQIRTGLEDELRRLQDLNRVLSGEGDKSVIHQLRAKLRWKRTALGDERDAVKRKKIEHEIQAIESDIKKEVERRERKG
jgi:hypothetical protein